MKTKLVCLGLSPVLLAMAMSVAIIAQQPTASAFSVERLRSHIAFLASDALEGRRTGSPGANDAAHYIAGEFSQMGLRPAFQTIRAPKNRGEARSNYRQAFPYVTGVTLGNGNQLSFKSSSLGTPETSGGFNVGQDWTPLGLSSNGRIESAHPIFVGYGITAAELKYDDYAGSDAKGRIAIAFSSTPDGDNPHGKFGRYEDVRWKTIAAKNAGATALIVIASEGNFKDDRLSRLQYDNSSGDAGLPVIAISRQAATKLLRLSDLAALVQLEAEAKGRPVVSQAQNVGSEATINLKTYASRQDETVSLAIDLTRREAAAYNIIGILEGSDPHLKGEAIVIGAHYDHLGHGGAGSLAPKEGEIHHGADDNASGVAAVLELARLLTTQRPRPRRSVVFIAFSGEEEGLLGSNYYVNHPVVPLANTVAMINLDMVGRMKNRTLIVGGVGTASEWRSVVDSANSLTGMTVTAMSGGPQTASGTSNVPIVVAANGRPIVSSDSSKRFQLTLNEDGYGPSDHSSFYGKQVPVLFFWTGTHEDYHKPSDTADKINYEDEGRIVAFVAHVVHDIDSGSKRPTYTVAKSEATGRTTGFRVYLGTIPNYSDATDGLLLDGVREDSPASRAGLKAGDKIVMLAGRDVRNVYDYTYALGEMRAGQEYEVEVVRGGQRLTLKLTPAARK
ncbi:MAG: M20/M25/M40 family metallo-hydrolase [Acidobacteriota bacterium]